MVNYFFDSYIFESLPDNPRAPLLLLRLGMIAYLTTWDNKVFKSYMKRIREEYPHSAEARQWPWME